MNFIYTLESVNQNTQFKRFETTIVFKCFFKNKCMYNQNTHF